MPPIHCYVDNGTVTAYASDLAEGFGEKFDQPIARNAAVAFDELPVLCLAEPRGVAVHGNPIGRVRKTTGSHQPIHQAVHVIGLPGVQASDPMTMQQVDIARPDDCRCGIVRQSFQIIVGIDRRRRIGLHMIVYGEIDLGLAEAGDRQVDTKFAQFPELGGQKVLVPSRFCRQIGYRPARRPGFALWSDA